MSSEHISLPAKGLGVAPWRAYALLFVFSMAQLLDIVNVTAPVIALPHIADDINLKFSERQWAINAYSLTFGAFLLTGGRSSTAFGPKASFIAGFAALGIGSIINGFSVSGPMLFVIRALQGIGAAITIPSAITMIVMLFPERGEQDMALAFFAGAGAIGNVGGLVIGGVISETVGWKWAFWIMAMVILPLCAITYLLSPSPPRSRSTGDVIKNMDWAGLFIITAFMILFVFAVTEGDVRGWGSKEVIPPLVISILLLPVFGYVETIAKEPLIPPWIWTLPTFTALFFIVMSEYAFMNIHVYQMSGVFQQVWGVSALNAAIRTIPFGLTGLFTTFAMGFVTPHVPPRWVLTVGQLFVVCGASLLSQASTRDQYWPFVFPAFIISALGIASGFVAANIAMLRTPLFKAGVDINETTALIGAIFNADLQIGSSLGLAIVTAITSEQSPDPSDFAGYKSSWWFVVALAAFEAIISFVFLRGQSMPPKNTNNRSNGTDVEASPGYESPQDAVDVSLDADAKKEGGA